jgi:hypothetical protein
MVASKADRVVRYVRASLRQGRDLDRVLADTARVFNATPPPALPAPDTGTTEREGGSWNPRR